MPTRQDGVENRDKVYGHALGFSALIQTLSKYLTCFFQEEEVEHYTQQLEDLEQQVQILEALKVRPEILTFVRIAESCCMYKCLQSVVFEEELEKAQNELSKQQLKDQQLKEKIQSLLEKADPFRVCQKLTVAIKIP